MEAYYYFLWFGLKRIKGGLLDEAHKNTTVSTFRDVL